MNSTEINTSNRSTTVNTPNSSSVFTTSNRSTTVTPPNRKVVVDTLAVVGFIALIGASMWLAVYSTRFVPGVVNRIGGAAVYLGSVFTPAPEPSLSVVSTPVASTTISFGTASSTSSTSSTTTTSVTTARTTPVPPAVPATGNTIPITDTIRGTPTGAPVTVTPYGLPDLTVSIDTRGYLTNASTDSFVVSPTVPSGTRPAVMVTVQNIGTNWTGTWRLSASFPGASTNNFGPLESIAPGGSNSYILSSDLAPTGANQSVTVTADSDHTIAEVNENNNSASVDLNIL